VARTLRAWVKAGAKWGGFEIERVLVNGQPGVVVSIDGSVTSVMSVEIADGQIQAIRSIVNPEKLRHLS
jgi:RNA polymerase sigma-70 factor (ECF subfamily)